MMKPKQPPAEISLKSRNNGCWYVIVLMGQALRANALASLTMDNVSPPLGSARCFIPLRLGHQTLAQFFLICASGVEQRALIEVDGVHLAGSFKIHVVAVPRAVAAVMLACLQPSILFPGGGGKHKKSETSLRKRLALAAIGLGPRISYPAWQRRFDCWAQAEEIDSLPGKIMAVVFTRGEQDRAALDATCAALAAPSRMAGAGLPVTVIDGAGDNPGEKLRAALAAAGAKFAVVLQAGEVIAPHAIGALVNFAELRRLAIVYADEDRMNFAGVRSDPVFKPEPSRMLMLSGALATGIFLLRRDALGVQSEGAARCADALRLDTWLRLDTQARDEGNAAFCGRLPLILTHRRPDTAATPPDLLAGIVRAHLGPAWVGSIDATRLPLRLCPGISESAPKVSLIVASTARLAHVRGCLSAVLEQTRYPDFEMIIVLSQSVPLDAAQQDILAPLILDARVRIVFAPMDRFNYSRANNAGIRNSAAPLICLLNDDVAPITPEWLAIMVGHFQDEHIAAVGAKLYYPEETVQHGGVIMGLSGLCDHSFRFLPRGEVGYAKRASVEQELSAVTAACMLIRKTVFEAVGGLDENFASAYNDVDLCLKIRAAGHGIIWSAQAELWHHETISFGAHYTDENKSLADRDIGIMRERWAMECAADPFHNPNLSLEPQREWELAFPPRLGDLPETLGLVACNEGFGNSGKREGAW